jgi:hypothetical protein
MTAPRIDDITAALWAIDPMRTGCTGDASMQDEYAHEAQEIASLMAAGTPLRTALVQVFDRWFWEGCLVSGADSSRLDAIVEKMAQIAP